MGNATFEVAKLGLERGLEIDLDEARRIMDRIESWTSREDLHAKIRQQLEALAREQRPAA
jgi:energy-converting hydrogenase A subunit M